MTKNSIQESYASMQHLPPMMDMQMLEAFLHSIELFNRADAFCEQTWLDPLPPSTIEPQPRSRDCTFYQLEELRYDSNFPQREAMENVLSALAGLDCRFVYLLSGDEQGVSIHFGVVRNREATGNGGLSAHDVGSILHDAFSANFQGSTLRKLREKELNLEIFDHLRSAKRGGLVMGIPSFNEQREAQAAGFQGIERLINGMLGQRWQMLIVCEPVATDEIDEMKRSVFDMYNQLHYAAKESVQQSESVGISRVKNTGTSDSRSTTKGHSSSSGDGSSSKGSNWSTSDTHGTNKGESDGANYGQTRSATREKVNKELLVLLNYIDTELLERIKLGQAKGMFKIAAYALADNQADFWRLSQLIKSVFQGDSSRFSPLRIHPIPQILANECGAMERLLCGMQHWRIALDKPAEMPCLFGHPIDAGHMSLSTLLTAKELSLLAGLPTREVPGIPMVEGVDFGVNPSKNTLDTGIKIGTVLHRGSRVKGKSISLDLGDLCRHVFVAGVTGSGKTTTCQKMLLESKLPFMVIEPAKTEYRSLANAVHGLKIFTLGNERLAPLRLNPFELFRFESITGHVDLLKAAFAAAFPMEAAMPYMLEDAIYRIYEKRGWDASGMQPAEKANRLHNDPWAPDVQGYFWPTMDDLLVALGEVVEKEGFDARLANDYRASLVSRLRNLTVGSKGSMLNCRISTDFETLMESQVVLEMDDLKDPQDKALMMGLILARVGEVVKERYRQLGGGTRHLTLIEEAHRLLAHPEMGSGDSSRHAVETFADMLAEIRKYGEGLVIVDQIPGKLMPEVLKNTNTKIIHKLFARDDREAVGDSMGLDEDQKSWLSRLKTGEVVVFSGQWLKPVHAMIDKLEDANEPDPKQLHHLFENLFVSQISVYFPALSGMDTSRPVSRIELQAFRDLVCLIRQCGAEASKTAKFNRNFCDRVRKQLLASKAKDIYEQLHPSFQFLSIYLAEELCVGMGMKKFSAEDINENKALMSDFLSMIFDKPVDMDIDQRMAATIWDTLYSIKP